MIKCNKIGEYQYKYYKAVIIIVIIVNCQFGTIYTKGVHKMTKLESLLKKCEQLNDEELKIVLDFVLKVKSERNPPSAEAPHQTTR